MFNVFAFVLLPGSRYPDILSYLIVLQLAGAELGWAASGIINLDPGLCGSLINGRMECGWC